MNINDQNELYKTTLEQMANAGKINIILDIRILPEQMSGWGTIEPRKLVHAVIDDGLAYFLQSKFEPNSFAIIEYIEGQRLAESVPSVYERL